MEIWEYIVCGGAAFYAICMIVALRCVERDEEDKRDV